MVRKGAGGAFCDGRKIKDPSGVRGAPFGGGFGFQGHLADVYVKMRRCPQPIISLIQGAASGGGFAFALASDIRVAGKSMKMNSAFIKIGLSSCDMGVSYFLPRLVGVTLASEMMLTGRFVDADRALSIGLVNEVVPDSGLAKAGQVFVDEMLATSPMGLRLTKEGLNMSIDAGSLEAAMAIENRNQVLCSGTEDFKEGLNGIKKLPIEAKFGVFMAYRYYSQLLKKLKKTPALDIKNTRIRVPNYKKIELLTRSYVKYQLNLL